MRIALVTSSFLPRLGGVEEHVDNVAADLARRGHVVSVWTVDQGDEIPTRNGFGVRALPCPLPTMSVRGVWHFLRRALPAYRQWIQAARADRPDVLHVHCFGPNGAWSLPIAARLRIPLAYSHHGETFMDAQGAFEGSVVMKKLLRVLLHRARFITSCSWFAAEDLARFGLGKRSVHVVYNGVRGAEPVLPMVVPRVPSPYVLGVGRLVHNKGFDLLIRAFAARAGDDPLRGVRLVIVGDGPERPRLAALARDQGIGVETVFVGPLSHGEVMNTMSAASMLVVPSRLEAFGMVVLEGWRARTPVIAPSAGGPAEIARSVPGAAILVDPNECETLGRAMVEALDPHRSREMVNLGERAVRKFTWDRVAGEFESLYTEAGLAISTGAAQ